MTSILIYLVLPYIAIGLITYVVFSRWDERFMGEDEHEPMFAVMAGVIWPMAWIIWSWGFFHALRDFKD